MTAIISACFFKKNFWENRYLVLLIGAGVALVATLTTNFAVRGQYGMRIEPINNKDLHTFYLPDSLVSDTCIRNPILGYQWYADYSATEFYMDSTKSQTPVNFILYSNNKNGDVISWGVFKSERKQNYYKHKDVFIELSYGDKAYVSKERLVYDIPRNSMWISRFSIPTIRTITTLHFPEKEYAMIPDSLIRKFTL